MVQLRPEVLLCVQGGSPPSLPLWPSGLSAVLPFVPVGRAG